MLEYLCKCLKCDSLMYDENPQTDAIKLDVSDISIEVLPMEQINKDGDTFWACGNCQTDSYLIDIDTKTQLL